MNKETIETTLNKLEDYDLWVITEHIEQIKNEYLIELKKKQQQIDKAIELLEPFIEIDSCMIKGKMLKPALSILKGENNENN